jgi:hypothetical protein
MQTKIPLSLRDGNAPHERKEAAKYSTAKNEMRRGGLGICESSRRPRDVVNDRTGAL